MDVKQPNCETVICHYISTPNYSYGFNRVNPLNTNKLQYCTTNLCTSMMYIGFGNFEMKDSGEESPPGGWFAVV